MKRQACRIWLALWFASAVVAGVASSADHDLPNALGAPRLWAHPLGFDAFGRDLLLGVLRSSVVSSLWALGSVLIACLVSLAWGSALALAPSTPRFVLARALDLLLAFPSLLFALAWAAVRGPGWDTLAFALLLGIIPALTRLIAVRAQELLSEEYILAARGLGASEFRIAARHLAPALLALCRVKAPNLLAHALMAEATLSFLGIGAPIGRDTWGALLAQARDYLIEAPHIAFGTGVPLFLTLLSLHLLAESRGKRAQFL